MLEKRIIRNGYVVLLKPDYYRRHFSEPYIYEHIYVMEQHIGQQIMSGYQVHHIDRQPLNNALDNLLLIPSQREHLRLHKLLYHDRSAYALELQRLRYRQEKVVSGRIQLDQEYSDNQNRYREDIRPRLEDQRLADLMFGPYAVRRANMERLLEACGGDAKKLSYAMQDTLSGLSSEHDLVPMVHLITAFEWVPRARNIQFLFEYLGIFYRCHWRLSLLLEGTRVLRRMLISQPDFRLRDQHYYVPTRNLLSPSSRLVEATKQLLALQQFQDESVEQVLAFVRGQGAACLGYEDLSEILNMSVGEDLDDELEQDDDSPQFVPFDESRCTS